MKKTAKSLKTLRIAAIGNVVVTKPQGPMNQVLVKVVASNITVPFGAPSTCSVAGISAIIERKFGTGWAYEAGPQTMSGNTLSGYDTTFGPRANGDFKATVTIMWNISHPDHASGLS